MAADRVPLLRYLHKYEYGFVDVGSLEAVFKGHIYEIVIEYLLEYQVAEFDGIFLGWC